jgi:glycosyltransferase involved in cell wall biosynthesis
LTKISIVIPAAFDPFVSETGPGAHVRGLSQSLCRLGCEVHILVPNSKDGNRTVNGVQLHYVSTSVNPFPDIPIAKDYVFSLISSARFREVVDGYCREHEVDIIHGMTPSLYEYGRMRKGHILSVITMHATAFGEFVSYFDVPLSFINPPLIINAMSEMLNVFLGYPLFKRVDKVIAVSKAIKEELVRVYHLPRERVVAIHNGIDLSSFTDLRVQEGKEHTILSVGRLAWRKGYKYLIDAMPNVLSEYSNAKLLLVGDVVTNEVPLQQYVRKRGIENSVLFLGNVSAERLFSLYHEAEVYVQPSLYEPFGITILEAMSMRKPVVATRVGGIPEIITNGAEGLLVEPRNSLQLGKAIINVFSDSSCRRRFGSNARKRVEREFTWEVIAKKTLEFYTNLLNDR